jgi:hypothetical protein
MFAVGLIARKTAPPIVPTTAYLNPTVGTATTPDPGPLTATFTIVFRVQGPSTSTGTVTAQYETSGQFSWAVKRLNTDGRLNVQTSANGTSLAGNALVTAGAVTAGVDEYLAVSVTLNNGSGFQAIAVKRSTNLGVSYTQVGTTTVATNVPWDSTSVVRVGADTGGGSNKWNGRIFAVEMRDGLDPVAGTVLWRFNAADYPGTGTTYVDPRGRTWTLTSASAIVPS